MTAVLICDDSNMARKQLAKILPDKWKETVFFAGHGAEALEVLQKHAIDWLFLDLNMPVMDGYQVLTAISKRRIPVRVVVVSGDIQPEAQQRVMAAGAVDFIKKPVDSAKLQHVMDRLLLVDTIEPDDECPEQVLEPRLRDVLQEVSNIAMGQAGDLLARLLNVFVKLPIPNVNMIDVSELHMTLASIDQRSSTSAVCQGFISGGISGEALLILTDSSFKDIARLMNHQGDLTVHNELELLMDIANILIGAALKGIAEQLDIRFSQGHAVILGQRTPIDELIKTNTARWKRTLTIEISYGIEGFDIGCDLLLLFTEDSLKTLESKLSFLLED